MKQLIKAAEELNELFGLDPEIVTENVTKEELEMDIKAAAEFIAEDDEFSSGTTTVLKRLGVFEVDKEVSKKILKEPEEEEPEEEELEEELEEEDYQAIYKEIKKASRLDLNERTKALKKIVKTYLVFEGIVGSIAGKFDVAEIRQTMLNILKLKGVKIMEKDEMNLKPKPEKPVKTAKVEKPAKEKKEKKAGGVKGPGVIATIVETIEAAGKKGVTKQEIWDILCKKFPDRDTESMRNTINVQVPNRIKKERWPVGVTEDGYYYKA